jgi:hypothetical protein
MQLHYPWGKPSEGLDVLWRCEAKRYSVVVDADREEYGVTPPRLEMQWFQINRRTPKGAWIDGKFVLLSATKRWACPTEDEAIESFKARKRKQISILASKLTLAERELSLTKPNYVELYL